MVYDATSLSKLIQDKKLSVKELVESTYDKIGKVNPELNAVTHTRPDKVEDEIDDIDFETPFAGVPTLLKGLGQSLKGEPDTSSSKLLKDNVATNTDNFVQSLLDSGLLVLGQTNAPEFGFKNITDPQLYGPTRNAWNTDYSSGGSSGGSASAVSSDMVSIAAGNDGGGSIRIPASFSGLIGLKPTRGRVPVGPNGWRGWQGASINFALTRSIRDTATLLDSIQTVQPAAPFSTPIFQTGFMQSLKKPLIKKFKVAYSFRSPVNTPVSEEAVAAVKQAVQFFDQQGIETVAAEPKIDGIALMKSYYVMNGSETAAMFDGINHALGREVGIDDMELTTWTIYQAGKLLKATDYVHNLEQWDLASYQADQFYDDYDLFLTPTTAYPAPKIDQELMTEETMEKMRHVTDLDKQERLDLIWEFFERSLTLSPFTQQANMTGQPAISLPTHVTKDGLPLGIQFTARKGNEALLLKVGQMFEDNGLLKFLHPTEQL